MIATRAWKVDLEKATEISFEEFPPLTIEDMEYLEGLYGRPTAERFRRARFMEWLRNSSFLNPRHRSLLRACVLVFGSLLVAWPAFVAPHGICASVLPLAALIAFAGSVDTARSMRRRWDFVHAGVLLLLYADMMIVALLTFMAFFPSLIAASAS